MDLAELSSGSTVTVHVVSDLVLYLSPLAIKAMEEVSGVVLFCADLLSGDSLVMHCVQDW